MKVTVFGRGLVFQPALLTCTYNNDTIIILQKKNRHYRFPSKFTLKKVVQARLIDMALKLNRLSVPK